MAWRPSVGVGVVRPSFTMLKDLLRIARPIKAKFYVEPPWVGGTIFAASGSHDQDGRHTHIW